MSERIISKLQSPTSSRRLALFIVVAACALLLGYYSATDPERLLHSDILGTLDYAGYTVCHRLTGHSFVFAGRQMPLCARCTGIYLGISLVFAVLILAGRSRWTALPSLPMLLVLGFFVAVMGVDGLNSYSHFFPDAPHLYEPKNWLRLVTGMGTGLGMGIVAFPALAQTIWKDQVYREPIAGWRELAGLLALAAILVALVLSNHPVLLFVLSIVSAVGVVIIITALNTILLLLVTRREARAAHSLQAVAPLAVGLALALLEIAAVSYVRFSLTGTMTGFPGM